MLDTSTPNIARAYDYLLGGGASFAADRALAARLRNLYPRTADLLLSSRTHLADSVTYVSHAGVDQYLDVGSGLPTRPNTHETARRRHPRARVVYVDRDPAVVQHGNSLVPSGVRFLGGDLAEPEALLGALPGLIDLSRPACLVLTMILQVLDPGTARAVAGVLVRALAPGATWCFPSARGNPGGSPTRLAAGSTPADVTSFFAGSTWYPQVSARARSSAASPAKGPRLMDEIAPGVFVATAEIYTTTTTVVAGAGGGCLVIDPAVTPADLARLAGWLSSRGLCPAAGWSTHPHWDHVLWSWPLGAAVRYATPRAVEAAVRKLPGLVSEMEESAPGHDLSLFARLAPLAAARSPGAGRARR